MSRDDIEYYIVDHCGKSALHSAITLVEYANDAHAYEMLLTSLRILRAIMQKLIEDEGRRRMQFEPEDKLWIFKRGLKSDIPVLKQLFESLVLVQLSSTANSFWSIAKNYNLMPTFCREN